MHVATFPGMGAAIAPGGSQTGTVDKAISDRGDQRRINRANGTRAMIASEELGPPISAYPDQIVARARAASASCVFISTHLHFSTPELEGKQRYKVR